MNLWTKIKLLFLRRKLIEHTVSDATVRVPIGSMQYYYDSIADVLYVPAHQYALGKFLKKTRRTYFNDSTK